LYIRWKKIFLPGWFNAVEHLLVHLPWEDRVGGHLQFTWMYSQERELEKYRVTVHYKSRAEGCIAEAFTCKEITNFSIKYFSCVNNVNAHMTWYYIVEEVTLSELSIFQLKGKCFEAPTAHYVTDEEWNYTMLYMYTDMEEVQVNFAMFDKIYWKQSEEPTLKHLDSMLPHDVKGGPSFLKWFCLHVIFCLHPFSFLIVVHLSHTSCVMTCMSLYIVYVECQCV
jgi:hypothetical protein